MTPIRWVRSLPAALLGLALLTPGALADASAPTPAVLAALAAEPPLPDIVEGLADAPATIVEYASLTCSHCAAFHKDVWPALKAKYVDTGKAKFTLREFPLDPLATGAFMLARCAGPGKRDAVVDRLFDHQVEWAFAANPLFKLKDQLIAAGMTEAKFDACLKDQALFDGVKAMHDIAAAKLDVRSTPTFFVDGQRLAGEHRLDDFDKILAPSTH
jgi:protein-disulfide isomerase